MAGDTRESPPKGSPSLAAGEPETPRDSRTPPNYEVFHSPPASANSLPPGSGQNTAGAKPRVTLIEAIKTVRLEDFSQVHMYPCVRESLLTGIGAGFGIGGLRKVLGAPVPKAANWAVGSFVFLSIANYEYCLYKRQIEKAYMKRAVEIMDRKKGEKEAEAKLKMEEKRRAKEEADRMEAEKKKGWRFW